MVRTRAIYPLVNEVHIHDILGWRRERVPVSPMDFPVKETPDWVCEISVSPLKKDTCQMPRILESAGVLHYWVVDAANEQLLVSEMISGRLTQTACHFRDDGFQRVPPFAAVELFMEYLFGDDEP